MGGIHIFEKPCYREIRAMRGRVMRGLPVHLHGAMYFPIHSLVDVFLDRHHAWRSLDPTKKFLNIS